jgi:integrase/recombinase XerD
MPSTFASVVNRIESLSNEKNRELIRKFVDYMKSTDASEKYRKDNLYVTIIYAEYLDDKDLSGVNQKQDIIGFLDTRRKDTTIDPDQRWIRTWNDYLQRIKYFMRRLHNSNDTEVSISDWQTPSFAQIKKKKTSCLSPYAESELWERQDLLAAVKYGPVD